LAQAEAARHAQGLGTSSVRSVMEARLTDKRLIMPSELLQVRVHTSIVDGDDMENVLYLLREDCNVVSASPVPWDDAFAATQATNFANKWTDFAGGLQTNESVVESVDWTWNESVPSGPLHEGSVSSEFGAPVPGRGTGNGLNTGLAICVRFKTGLGGRANHGRTFIGALDEGASDPSAPNHIDPITMTAVLGNATAFLNGVNNNDCVLGVGDQVSLVVASFVLNGAQRLTATYRKVVTADVRNDILSFQKRRTPGHSRHH
jgi:hypothetical protein